MDKHYLELFKRDYYCCAGGKDNLEIQVKHLARLGEKYHSRFLKLGKWTDCLKVSLFSTHAGIPFQFFNI